MKAEIVLNIPAEKAWQIYRDNKILSRINPDMLASAEYIEGDGSSGSLRVLKLGPGKYLLHLPPTHTLLVFCPVVLYVYNDLHIYDVVIYDYIFSKRKKKIKIPPLFNTSFMCKLLFNSFTYNQHYSCQNG